MRKGGFKEAGGHLAACSCVRNWVELGWVSAFFPMKFGVFVGKSL
jgi:hypothetical protein